MHLRLAWCELLGREVEYLALSRDTTESDLKQRREIRGGSLLWADQPPVRAAREGRVLILDGLEKAERNVLPTLNNLLENREMSLQDGTFLTSPERFDSLALADTEGARLVRVHQDFRVIALGLPVPVFPGFPLDPPLRSRFQARHVGPPSLPLQLAELRSKFPGVPLEVLEALASFCDAVAQMSSAGSEVPGPKPWPVPDSVLALACASLARFPAEPAARMLHRAYPYSLLPAEAAKACSDSLVLLRLYGGDEPSGVYPVVDVQSESEHSDALVLSLASGAGGGKEPLRVRLLGGGGSLSLAVPAPLVDTATHSALLSEALQVAAEGRSVCFVGPAGEGKSALARRFAAVLGFPSAKVFTLHVYKDMTSRDLFQRHSTDASGDTRWEPSPLLTAALTGGLCVLDGLQRLRPDTLAALQTLCSDQDVDLPDGTRLCRPDRFEAARVAGGAVHGSSARLPLGLLCRPTEVESSGSQSGAESDQQRWLQPVHGNFRLVALALPPGQKPADQWLSAELLPLFGWIVVPRLASEERAAVLATSDAAADTVRINLPMLAEQDKPVSRWDAGDGRFVEMYEGSRLVVGAADKEEADRTIEEWTQWRQMSPRGAQRASEVQAVAAAAEQARLAREQEERGRVEAQKQALGEAVVAK
ncbi:unnamed protein product, partial [Polarella glacialis]